MGRFVAIRRVDCENGRTQDALGAATGTSPMKISVSYGDRTYGNSQPSCATEIRISGSQSRVCIKVEFKQPKPGRSWDWLSAGSVGGAKLELGLADANALAQGLLEFVAALENYDPFNEQMHTRVRLRECEKPDVQVVRSSTHTSD